MTGIYTVYDSKGKFYLQPFFARNDDMAVRDMANLVNSDHPFNQTAEDFSLFKVGEYDEIAGEIIPFPPEHLVNLHTLRIVDDRNMKLPDVNNEKGEAAGIIFMWLFITLAVLFGTEACIFTADKLHIEDRNGVELSTQIAPAPDDRSKIND